MNPKKPTKNLFENLFLHSKPVKMLIELKKDSIRYATQVSKAVDCTYSHVVKILQQMNKAGLVNFNKQGRLKLLSLTKKGDDVAANIDKVLTQLKN